MPIVCVNCGVKKANSKFKSGGDVLKTCIDCREEISSSEDNEVEQNESDSESESETESIYCDACDKTFDDVEKAKRHAMTQSHQKKWNAQNKN